MEVARLLHATKSRLQTGRRHTDAGSFCFLVENEFSLKASLVDGLRERFPLLRRVLLRRCEIYVPDDWPAPRLTLAVFHLGWSHR
jgi:hypothetical protein